MFNQNSDNELIHYFSTKLMVIELSFHFPYALTSQLATRGTDCLPLNFLVCF